MGKAEMWYVNGLSTGIRLKDAAQGVFRRKSVSKKSVKKRKYTKVSPKWNSPLMSSVGGNGYPPESSITRVSYHIEMPGGEREYFIDVQDSKAVVLALEDLVG